MKSYTIVRRFKWNQNVQKTHVKVDYFSLKKERYYRRNWITKDPIAAEFDTINLDR
jgi:hypothetical protein